MVCRPRRHPTPPSPRSPTSLTAPLLQDPALLQQLIKFHIVPPEPVRNGLWSSPLLSVGPKLYTAYDGPQTLRGAVAAALAQRQRALRGTGGCSPSAAALPPAT